MYDEWAVVVIIPDKEPVFLGSYSDYDKALGVAFYELMEFDFDYVKDGMEYPDDFFYIAPTESFNNSYNRYIRLMRHDGVFADQELKRVGLMKRTKNDHNNDNMHWV